MSKLNSTMIDLAFALQGRTLPREHRHLLADAIERVLPWLPADRGTGIHRLNVVAGEGDIDLISGRTRLTLRVPRERAADAAALTATELDVGGHRLMVGAAQTRELLAHGTLYAHLVTLDSLCGSLERADEEASLMSTIESELAAMHVRSRPICGRWRAVDGCDLLGCSLMLDGLEPADSLRVLERGLGSHRRLGCGLFVPHKSTAAVGTPL